MNPFSPSILQVSVRRLVVEHLVRPDGPRGGVHHWHFCHCGTRGRFRRAHIADTHGYRRLVARMMHSDSQ